MRTEEMQSRLFAALAKGDRSALVHAAYEIMQLPIVVSDAAFVITDKFPKGPFGDEQWDANIVGERIQEKFVQAFIEDNHLGAYGRNNTPIYTNWGHFEKAPRLSAIIERDKQVVGYVAALANDNETEPWQLEAVELIAKAYAIIWHGNYEFPYDNRKPAVLLQGALAGAYETREDFEKALSAIYADNTPRPGFLLMALKQDSLDCSAYDSYVFARVHELFDDVSFASYGETCYMLVSGVREGRADEKRLDAAARIFRLAGVRCGMSRINDSLYPLDCLRWQADHALEMGKQLNPERDIYCYDDYLMPITAEALEQCGDWNNFVSRPLLTLHRYDQQNGTDYLQTLASFLSNMGSTTKTASNIFAHRNTVRYRLNRIEEIAGISKLEIADFIGIALCSMHSVDDK